MKKSKALQTRKAKRIQCHQTSFATYAKRTSLCGKHKRKGKKERKQKRPTENKHKIIKKMQIRTYMLIISLNELTKKQRLAERIRKQDPYMPCL